MTRNPSFPSSPSSPSFSSPYNPSSWNLPVDRRSLLRTSGLALSLGALVAACGQDRTGLEEPGRVGNAPPPPTLPDTTINDVVFLRTAQSIEYLAIDVYGVAAGLGVLDAASTQVVSRFVQDHTNHADALGELIVAADGEPFTCANPWFMERAITPILGAIETSDDVVRDVLSLAHGLEALAGSTYQLFIGLMQDPALRRAAMTIGAEEERHAATLAMAITGTPKGYLSPALAGEEVLPDDAGFPIPYAIPSRFGQVTAKDLVLGARDEVGARFTIGLQTPAENSYVYEYMSC
jgi:hypothetical protein